jgi:hypothetical protein
MLRTSGHFTSGPEVTKQHYTLNAGKAYGSLFPPIVIPVLLFQTTIPGIGNGGVNASGGPQLQ